MNKKFVVIVVAVAFLVVFWTVLGVETHEVPYATVQDLLDNPTHYSGRQIRLGGSVDEGSIVRSEDNPLLLNFRLRQGIATVPVAYHKVVPDLFRDGVEVIVEGSFAGGRVAATNLMTKCASRYEGDLRAVKSGDAGS